MSSAKTLLAIIWALATLALWTPDSSGGGAGDHDDVAVRRGGGRGGAAYGALSPQQREALVDLYLSTAGESWYATDGWYWHWATAVSNDPCVQAWTGVVCSAAGSDVTYVLFDN